MALTGRLLREAAKNLFLEARPLRRGEGVRAWPLRNKKNFEAPKKIQKNVDDIARGGATKKITFFASFFTVKNDYHDIFSQYLLLFIPQVILQHKRKI